MDVSVKITPVIRGADAKRLIEKLENPAPLTVQEKKNRDRIKKYGGLLLANRVFV